MTIPHPFPSAPVHVMLPPSPVTKKAWLSLPHRHLSRCMFLPCSTKALRCRSCAWLSASRMRRMVSSIWRLASGSTTSTCVSFSTSVSLVTSTPRFSINSSSKFGTSIFLTFRSSSRSSGVRPGGNGAGWAAAAGGHPEAGAAAAGAGASMGEGAGAATPGMDAQATRAAACRAGWANSPGTAGTPGNMGTPGNPCCCCSCCSCCCCSCCCCC
mmetsp:Transcript_9634/g.27316  ORF Transcript_9634/g.27316 Transcript_9634/m.27316 type:complete len:213 (-) Transcript_9634:26-664(-)